MWRFVGCDSMEACDADDSEEEEENSSDEDSELT